MATPQQVIEAVRSAFNARSSQMTYGTRAAAHFPIKTDDLTAAAVSGSDSGWAVSRCRHLCVYVIAQHCVAVDPILNRERQYSYEAIARIFGRRTKQAVYLSMKECCALLQEDLFRSVYAEALSILEEQGLKLLNVRKRTPCDQ